MNSFKKVCSILWRLWFYVWMLIVILFLSPALLLTIWSTKQYPYFFKIARIWAMLTFYGIGMRYDIKIHQELVKNKSYMLIANHTSMLDIMVMLLVVKDNPFVFVGKQELANIPLFGFFYKKTCILVDRKNSRSRHQVFQSAQERLSRGLSICIFPEGGVSDDLSIILADFKDGAFRLAIDHQIPIVPLSFGNLKYHFPFAWGFGYPGRIPVVIHPFIETMGKTQEDKKEIKAKAYDVINSSLLQWEEERKQYKQKRDYLI